MSLKSDSELRQSQSGLVKFAVNIEQTFLRFVEEHSLQLLRYALVAVYVWFGLLTATGVSQTAALIADPFWFVPRGMFLIVLGGWEIAVGLALLSRRTLRFGVILLMGHAMVAMLPLVLYPGETFSYFPYGPSFEGVYIIKDWVLLAAAMTVGGLIDTTE